MQITDHIKLFSELSEDQQLAVLKEIENEQYKALVSVKKPRDKSVIKALKAFQKLPKAEKLELIKRIRRT